MTHLFLNISNPKRNKHEALYILCMQYENTLWVYYNKKKILREKDWFGCKVSFYDELPFIYCREMHTRHTKNKHSLTEYLSVNEISEYYDFEEVYLLLFNFTYNKSFAFWDIFNFFDINVFVVSGYIHHIDFAGSRLEGTRKIKCIL